jgi:hypothetical protein
LSSRGKGLFRLAAPAAQAGGQLAHRAAHVLEVLDRREHRLQHREHLVLDVAQALLGVDALDLEVRVRLARALVVRPAHVHDALPLAAHAEDGVHRRDHAQRGLAEVVLQALEDEGRVHGVRLHHRHLGGQAVAAALGHPFRLAGIARGDVDARQAPVELGGRGHLAHHETELVVHPRGHGLGRKAERHPVGRVHVHDRRERQQQRLVVGRGLALEQLEHLGQVGRPAGRI